MGTDDTAVTDARLRVGRIARLRIGDASVVRPPTSNNTQAVTAMLGPYAADLVIPALEPTTHKEAA